VTEPPDRITVIRRALELIQDRGWTTMMSTSDTSALNIRSAISRACTDQIGSGPHRQWYEAYLDAVHAIANALGEGITDWEFRVKASSEVEAMLTEVIKRLENGDIESRASRRRPSGV